MRERAVIYLIVGDIFFIYLRKKAKIV